MAPGPRCRSSPNPTQREWNSTFEGRNRRNFDQPLTLGATPRWSPPMRSLSSPFSVLSLAGLLVACTSNVGGPSVKGSPDAGLDTSTSPGSGGVGGTIAETGGTGGGSSSGGGG